jgi:hypothetical protein
MLSKNTERNRQDAKKDAGAKAAQAAMSAAAVRVGGMIQEE